MRGEQTRTTILEAAIVRFGRDGYRATSVADVARDAGVGATITYNYFPNKEALFLAALDEDAAAVIEGGVTAMLEDPEGELWRENLLISLVDAMDHHPLARRVLSGLEPHVTGRVLDLPVLAELRKACAERLRTGQANGTVRTDIDPVALGSGAVVITISLLMSILQFGREGVTMYGNDVIALMGAAFDPPA